MSTDLWTPVRFGKTELRTSRLGVGSSYGVGGADLERAYDRGVRFFFYGLRRRADFGAGLRRIAAKDRAGVVLAAQSYTRVASLMRPSLESALRTLGTDHVDLLGLGWWNDVPPPRILEAAERLVREGKVRHVLISSHQRPSFVPMMDAPSIASIMIRYNAAHTGAEREVFPHSTARDVGVLAFTATRWGGLVSRRLVPEAEPVPRASDCYRFVLTNPAVHATLCGPRDGAELDEAMAALDRGPMDADELAWMRRVGAGVRARANERALGWVDRVVSALRGRRRIGVGAG